MSSFEYRSGNWWIREHTIDVPLDHARPDGETITVFARDLVGASDRDKELPLLLFLQGGPGGEGPRPLGKGWWAEAAKTHRVVLLDQRGTGRSSPIDAARLAARGGPEAQADYLALFRGDAIVRDAEALRAQVYGGAKWATLGQSYGGFLTLIYLSLFPGALTACHITGGLPSVSAEPADVYRATYPRQGYLNERFYRTYPGDEAVIGRLADRLAAEPARLPDGDLLDVRRLQLLGQSFGMSTGIDGLHWLLDTALPGEGADGGGQAADGGGRRVDGSGQRAAGVVRRADGGGQGSGGGAISPRFLAEVAARTSFYDNPLYAVLQECIYCQGGGAAGWAAEAELARQPRFADDARPLFFTGEMIYPWMFEAISSLRPFAAATAALNARTDWPALYNPARLAANEVPVAAIQYFDDPYVELGLALTNREAVGNLEVWVTSEYLHDGLRMSPEAILPRLFEMTAGR